MLFDHISSTTSCKVSARCSLESEHRVTLLHSPRATSTHPHPRSLRPPSGLLPPSRLVPSTPRPSDCLKIRQPKHPSARHLEISPTNVALTGAAPCQVGPRSGPLPC